MNFTTHTTPAVRTCEVDAWDDFTEFSIAMVETETYAQSSGPLFVKRVGYQVYVSTTSQCAHYIIDEVDLSRSVYEAHLLKVYSAAEAPSVSR